MQYPIIEFEAGLNVTENDRKLYRFLVNYICVEYRRNLKRLDIFEEPIHIRFVNRMPQACACLGLAEFSTSKIMEFGVVGLSEMTLTSVAGILAHEIAHLLIQRVFKSQKIGNNATHYGYNALWVYSNMVISRAFTHRYLLSFARVPLLDIKRVCDNVDMITRAIASRQAPKGINPYW